MEENRCFNNSMNILLNGFNECNISDKFIIIFIKLISFVLILCILIGITLPRHMIIYYFILCLIILYFLETNYLILNKIINNSLKNSSKLSNNEITYASIQTPFSLTFCKIIMIILLLIAINNYINPNYSFNAICKNTYNYINDIDTVAKKELDSTQNIATEFKINEKQDQVNKKMIDLTQMNEREILYDGFSTNKIEPSSTDKIDDGSNMKVFDKIYKPKIEIITKENIKENIKESIKEGGEVGKPINKIIINSNKPMNNDIIIKF